MQFIFHCFFGKDTKAAETINIIISVAWFLILGLECTNLIVVRMPNSVVEQYDVLSILLAFAALFNILALIKKINSKRRNLFRASGLLFGALGQAILASLCISSYPPFEPITVVSVVLSLWFLIALFYITSKEGADGDRNSSKQ